MGIESEKEQEQGQEQEQEQGHEKEQGEFVLALDEGTTSCRAILFDRQGRAAASAQQEFVSGFPQAGWVEQDADEIWRTQLKVMREAASGVSAAQISAIGITNQRETLVVWDPETGEPLHQAIVWQCRRTSAMCESLKADGWEAEVRARTGLVLDPYFSGTKLKWLLDEVPGLREKAEAGRAIAGTIDSWLIWKLTEGAVHATDVSNASRTMLFNIHTLAWDEEILAKLGIPAAMLPEVKPSSGIFGYTRLLDGDGGAADSEGQAGEGGSRGIPIAGVAGDQQAALFGQGCYESGMAKNTYGTGCFLLTNTGEAPIASEKGLLTTIAWQMDGRTTYALEGSVFTAGSVVQWLRDGLGLITHASESESIAASVADTLGVYIVPAFTGLGTPYWNAEARGMITGLTRGATSAHLVRAALESIAYQTADVLGTMEAESGLRLKELRVDGGAVANSLLMQFQADLLGVSVIRPVMLETTALGAAFLAGLGVGFWSGTDELRALWEHDRTFVPERDEAWRASVYSGWQKAVGYQL
ncbi:glycerol kinase [Paenibacillus taihuensis]|uniref:Glycerol kinase n=1 Tax=Paenibacillus taihuensis TaxID=1156355 RepID=A0A3D9RPV5_9BACL|nr:glycerol kinase GlpK [Paenibacillus taihuensis]REE78773.1 glycerol kinase [Paenibacillus taihuensis]